MSGPLSLSMIRTTMPAKLSPSGAPAAALLLACCGIASSALAQGVPPPDAGQVLRDNRPAPAVVAPPAAPTLRIEERPEAAAAASARFDVRAVRITGSTAFPADELAALVADVVGSGRTLAELEAAARRIGRHYRERGYAVARAYVPAQDVRDGVVTIAVLEGELGRRSLDNRSGRSARQAQAVLDRLPEGRPVLTEPTNRALLLLGELPGLGKVGGRLSPGDRLGRSDLLVAVEPGKAVEGSLGVDNFGNRYTGANRLTGQLALNDLLGLADRLSLRGTVSDERLLFGRVAWDAAVGADGLRAGASAIASSYRLGKDFAALQAHGTAQTAAAYATYPLLLRADTRVRVGGSLEKRWIKDRFDATGTAVDKNARALVLEVSGDRVDALGGGGLTYWRVGPTFGRLSIDTPAAAAADLAGAQTAGGYAKWTASIAREQRLPGGFSAYASASGQRTTRNLDSSEKFVLGGVDGIRAYPQGEAAGDQGWLTSLELRYALQPTLRGTAFYDAGGVEINRNAYLASDNRRHLSGYGVGLAAVHDAFVVTASLAWRGGSQAPLSDRDRSPRLWLQGAWRF